MLDPNAAKSDFGSVNQGQLKNMAKKAYAELRNALPSEIWTTPQGQALAALVDSWNPAQPGNFDLINQGQLKAVAKKFYDVLILHGYTNAYPWTGATTAAANDALANLGQLKNLFSFDLPRDSDGGGISDGLETKFNLNPFNAQTNLTPPQPLLIGVPNDWQGWTRIGRSDDLGVYGSGSTSAPAFYDVYANQFYLNAASGTSNIPVGNQYVTGDPTGLFTYSPDAFTGENRILGIGVQGLPGSNVSGFTPTVKFALGDNTYSAATSVPGTDGRVSFSLYSHPGDFTVQFQPVEFGGSQILRPSNITFRGNDNKVYTLPGGIGSGASYDFAFRAIPLTSSNSYQMFFDLTKMQTFYSNLTKFQTLFDRQAVAVAPGTSYNGEGIGTIGSELTIAFNGLSNNTTVFSVDAPPRPPVEVVELSPKLRDDSDTEITGSEKPAVAPKATEMVERDPGATPAALNDASAIRIAWRDMKVKIGKPLAGKKVTWSMTPRFTPLQAYGIPETVSRFRGKWGTATNTAHQHRFSASDKFQFHDYIPFTQILEEGTNVAVTISAQTTVDAEGYTAIRVNLPPIGFNKARIKIKIEGVTDGIDLIDLEVPAVVTIDPGHGGPDSGNSLKTVTPPLVERELTLLYSTELKTTLQNTIHEQGRSCKVLVGKQTGDNGLKYPNDQRAILAREQGADIHLALHFNGGGQSSSGTQVCILSVGEGNVNRAQDLALANRMYAAGEAVFGAGNRDPDQRIIDLGPDTNGRVFLRDTPNFLNNVPGPGRESTFIRAALLELEYLTPAGVANKLTGPNATTTRENYGIEAAQAVINDLLNQP